MLFNIAPQASRVVVAVVVARSSSRVASPSRASSRRCLASLARLLRVFSRPSGVARVASVGRRARRAFLSLASPPRARRRAVVCAIASAVASAGLAHAGFSLP